MFKQQVKRALKSRYGSVDRGLNPFAVEAGVNRWSLKRWLHEPQAGISTRTLEKLQAAMFRLEQK
jgi:hypothetical protein